MITIVLYGPSEAITASEKATGLVDIRFVVNHTDGEPFLSLTGRGPDGNRYGFPIDRVDLEIMRLAARQK